MFKKPPYTITEKAADYLAKIVENVTRLEFATDFTQDIRLHRENRVKTIHSSLAIESNTLSLSEVTAVIEGKLVRGKQREIKEVENAYEAYDEIMTFDPYSIEDFLTAHNLMTNDLVKESGKFRSGDVGVFDGDKIVHVGARPQFVAQLMQDLFLWAKRSNLHPVLKSAIVHYEIETIHPFEDGNGRMGRLWQTLLLAKWKEMFAWIPMETVLYQNRQKYYKAIEESRKANDSGIFIEFTLKTILDTITLQVEHQVEHHVEHRVELTKIHHKVLRTLVSKSLSRKEIFSAIGRNGDSRSFRRNVEPLIIAGLIEKTVPDKPTSKLQKYRLTEKGRLLLKGNLK